MNYSSEYDIANPAPMPWWVMMIPSLKRIWEIPVSQHLYKPPYASWVTAPIITFITGLILSLILNIVFRAEVFREAAFDAAFITSLAIPIVIATGHAVIRIIISSLFVPSLLIGKKLPPGKPDSWLTVPITDSDFFHGLIFPGLMSGLRSVENVLALTLGLAIPFFIFLPAHISSSPAVLSLLQIEAGIWILFLPILLVYLLTFSSGLYAIIMPTGQALAFAVAHSAILAGFAALLRMAWFSFVDTGGSNGFYMAVIGELLSIAILFGLAALTGWIGVMAFARYRREGFYQPEWASAAGLTGG